MTRTTPREHGTYAKYKKENCHCEPCRTEGARVNRRNAKLRAMGKSTLVDAAPVAQHLRALVNEGMTTNQIEDASGVHRTGIRRILGTFPNRPPVKRVRPSTAEALMKVRPTIGTPVKTAMVDATGTRRRLQALMAIGYTARNLAARLGKGTPQIQVGKRALVKTSTAREVAALYAELEHTVGPSRRCAARARTFGYLPPAWWDEDTIDDPRFEPDGTRLYEDRTPKMQRQNSPRREEAVLVDDLTAPRAARVLRMAELGYSAVDIAQRMGVALRYVQLDLRENQERAS